MAFTSHHSWLSALNCTNANPIPWKKNPNFFPSTYPINPNLKYHRISSSLGQPRAESSQFSSPNSAESPSEADLAAKDPVKLAFARAKAYKKSISSSAGAESVQNPVIVSENNDGNGKCSQDVKLAFMKAKEYKKNKGVVVDGSRNVEGSKTFPDGGTEGTFGGGHVEKKVVKKDKLSVSKMDFMGLNFSDEKKGQGLPAGLVPLKNPLLEGDLPEVQLIVGDRSKFDTSTPLASDPVEEDDANLYKPKVSTWGVFPRPRNISNAFGGGKVIHPGEALETAEDKAVKEAQTKKLIAAYRDKVGLNINPTLRANGEKVIPFYTHIDVSTFGNDKNTRKDDWILVSKDSDWGL